jgi:hypothetical protein
VRERWVGDGGVREREVRDGGVRERKVAGYAAWRWSGGPRDHTASARWRKSGKPDGSLRACFAGRRCGVAGHPAPLET